MASLAKTNLRITMESTAIYAEQIHIHIRICGFLFIQSKEMLIGAKCMEKCSTWKQKTKKMHRILYIAGRTEQLKATQQLYLQQIN